MDQYFIPNLKETIIQAGEIAVNLREKGLTIERKKDYSPVTNADIQVSDFIYKKLTKLDPNIPVICEERPLKNILKDSMFWLVDPIDGTKSYIRNMDSFTVNIALISNQVPKVGLIYQPALKKLYFTDDEGNFCAEQNGHKVREIKREDDSFIAVVSSRNFNEKTENYIRNNPFSEIIAVPSSIKLCMVAEGSADIYPKFGPTMEWDIAAGHALVNAAGGIIIDQTSNQSLLYGKTGFKNSEFLAFNDRTVHNRCSRI